MSIDFGSIEAYGQVSPAMIEETGMIPSDEAVGGIKHKIPVGRLGKTFEVSNVVNMFLDTVRHLPHRIL